MKKLGKWYLIVSLILMSLVSSLFTSPITVNAQVDIDAESAILVDASTGEILYAKNADIALPPASMTKMMTEYLVLEAIEKGIISWDTKTEISQYAYDISANNSFSGVGLRLDHEYTVKELYDAMAIYSDNATSIALAELIAGSEGEFVKMMNAKAEEMGLPEAKFVNSTGLHNSSLGDNYPEGTDPNADNLMSARSSALLAYHLVNDYPEVLEVSSIPTKEFEGHTMINYNWMLPGMPGHLAQFSYEGLDGLKTGWTSLAGYCFTGTAERNGTRLISVVMRTDSEADRFNETRKLMDYGFSQFEKTTLFDAGYQIEEQSILQVEKGKQSQVQVASAEPIEKVIKIGEKDKYTVRYEFNEDLLNENGALVAPVEEGLEVGRMILEYNGEHSYGSIVNDSEISVPLVTTSSVEKANWFVLLMRSIGDFFISLFESIKGIFS